MGDIEFTMVKGTHEPIITEEEFNKVQEMISSRRRTIKNSNHGQRQVGGGKISRDVFQTKKAEVEDRMVILQKELDELAPREEVEEVLNYEEKITLLRYALEQYTDFSDEYGKDIPEEVIEAFVEKIVVSKNNFDWYLRFSPDDDPKRCNVVGKRAASASVLDISPSLVHSSTGSDCGEYSEILFKHNAYCNLYFQFL